MSAVNALSHPKRSLATAAVRPATSPATAPTKVLVEALPVALEPFRAQVDRNATSVVKSVTLPATALRVAEATALAIQVATSVEAVEAVGSLVVDKPVTRAVATDTCLAIAHKVKSATIVSDAPTPQ